jgi:hypothetical protein
MKKHNKQQTLLQFWNVIYNKKGELQQKSHRQDIAIDN